MPTVSKAVNMLARTIQARQTLASPPPFAPFRQPEDVDGDDINPFRLDPDDLRDDDDHRLTAGTIAAIVVSIVVFFIVISGLVVYFTHLRRKARRDVEIAMKESISVTAVTTSGALDPPPPYDASHLDSHNSPQELRQSRSDFSPNEEEEDSDVMGSHATITDGLAPGRHTGSGVHTGSETHTSSDIYRGPGSVRGA
ncbi:hypothetical protein B0I37DRAFT_88911 [Chaetomium sp. MPI-CAGE-AT-0009]|nr:hypothetical protein B0I37DRAFT_88911 [Chaetomium sp. MPI-CAGE-AT-0009]